jgi:hypothetical protein
MAGVESSPEIREMLLLLARRYAFREVAFLLGGGVTGLALSQREVARLQQLCAYGQRLFDLDAEDLDKPDAAVGANTDTTFADMVGDELVPEHLVQRGELCHIRRQSDEHVDDALHSLRPAYRLLLEVIQVRWQRHETLSLLAAAHIAAEYAPLLAWEPSLGHAGDPVRLRKNPAFAGPASRWGHADDPECPHTRPEKAAASRALRVATEPPSGWQAYLDRQHSIVSQALGVCATACPYPCTVVTSQPDRGQLAERTRLAIAFDESALVRLRHRAPVGHGFGVPSRLEVAEAWQRGREGIARRGGLARAVLTEDDYPLPGLPSLFSAIAGTPVVPDTLLADTLAEIVRELSRSEDTAVPAPANAAALSEPAAFHR